MVNQEQIVKRVEKLFFRYGIKSLTMDEIAFQLGISKKSLYDVVCKKDELVELVTINFVTEQKATIEKISLQSTGRVQELLAIAGYVTEMLSMVSESMFYDLKKSYSESWQMLFDFYYKFLFNKVKTNIEYGVKEGVYRESIKADFVAGMFLGTLRMLFRKEVSMHKFSSDSINLYLELLLTGMASKKGLQVFKKHLDIKAPSN